MNNAAPPNLASMERRLLAAMLDSFLLLLGLVFLYVFLDEAQVDRDAFFMLAPGFYVAVNALALLRPGWSVGRTVMGIQVVSIKRGGCLTVWQAVLRPAARLGLFLAAALPAVVAGVLWPLAVPLVADLVLISVHPWRQSLEDIAVGTLVLVLPPVQPHRAPAAPMYSAADAEFGLFGGDKSK